MILMPFTTPMPSQRNPDSPMATLPEGADFVDELVVQRVIAGPTCRRVPLYLEETFLAAEDLDFAGWRPLKSAVPAPVAPARPAPAPVVSVSPVAALPPEPARLPVARPLPGPARRVGPAWFGATAGLFCGVLFAIALLGQHQLAPRAAKWLPAQPAAADSAIPQAVTSNDAR